MSYYQTFCVLIVVLMTITQAFFIQKQTKYHHNNLNSNKKHAFINSGYHLNYYTQVQKNIQTDMRGTFFENSFSANQETQDIVQNCNFRPNDFHSKVSKSVHCMYNNEFIVVRHEQFWCIGYLSGSSQIKSKKTGVLSLKLDRSFQVEYSPGNMKAEKYSVLGMKLFMEAKHLNTVTVRSAFDGLPELIEIEFEGKKICKRDKHKKLSEQQSQEDSSSEEGNLKATSILDKSSTDMSGLAEKSLNLRQKVKGDLVLVSDRSKTTSETKRDDIITPQNQTKKFNPCGKRQLHHSELISNGQAAKSGDWPFHATIFHTSIRTFQYKCGGVIISKSIIVTAAHCILENGKQIIAERVRVHLGRGNLQNFDTNSQEFEVFDIICHENFNRDNVRHDIALLKLATNIAFTQFIQPACLPDNDFKIVNKIGSVIGFGRTESGNLSPVLREARMHIPSIFDCLESNRDFYGFFLYDGNFCAGQLNEKAVACTGDSGGGIYFNVNGAWTVRGIVSVGMRNDNEEGCSLDNYVLYTDIYKHMSWINKNKM